MIFLPLKHSTDREVLMKKNYFLIELIKSVPFRIFIILVLIITLIVMISKRREKTVRMKEDILYLPPKQEQQLFIIYFPDVNLI